MLRHIFQVPLYGTCINFFFNCSFASRLLFTSFYFVLLLLFFFEHIDGVILGLLLNGD